MGPKKSPKKVEKDKPTKSEKPEEALKTEDAQVDPTFINPITVKILSLFNLRDSRVSEVSCALEFAGNRIGEASPKVKVEPKQNEVEINYEVKLPCEIMNKEYWRTICSNPIMITFYYTPEVAKSSATATSTDSKDSKKSKRSETSTKSGGKSKKGGSVGGKDAKKETKETVKQQPVLGCCNFDLLPVLLGADFHSVNVRLEKPGVPALGSKMAAHETLPMARLRATPERPMEVLDPEEYNIVAFTLEAIYNPPETWGAECKAATWLPREMPVQVKTLEKEMDEATKYDAIDRKGGLLDEFIQCSDEALRAEAAAQAAEQAELLKQPEPSLPIIFPSGSLTNEIQYCPTRHKRWSSLMTYPGKAGLSLTHKFNKDLGDLHSDVDESIDIAALYGKSSRMQWDLISRHWLHGSCQPFLERRLGLELWPVEFLVTPASKGSKEAGGLHYMALLNFKAMMYPGVTKYRVASPLYEFEATQLQLNTKEEVSILVPPAPPAPEITESKASKVGKAKPEKKPKAVSKKESKKGSTKSSKEDNKDAAETESTVVIEEPTGPPPIPPLVPVLNEKGEPTFCIIQLEFRRPIIQKRSFDDMCKEIDNLIPKRFQHPKVVIDALEAEKQFREAIRSTIDIVMREYEDFAKTQISFVPEGKTVNEVLALIVEHLKRSGSYQSIKKILSDKVSMLVNQKFSVGHHLTTNFDYQSLMTDVYTYISKEAHSIVNTEISMEPNYTPPRTSINSEELWQFAMEADALGDAPRAKQYLLEIISVNKEDPDKWLDYAVFCLGKNDPDKALECTSEALGLNPRHKLSMLLHGILLVEREEMKVAETFLLGLLNFYPHFVEGWIVLHLVYQKTDYICGADSTLQYACEIHSSGLGASVPQYLLSRDYLTWNWEDTIGIGMFIPTAILLLKLNAFEFAELALAQELIVNKENERYLYVLAVHHFLQRRYDDSLSHLNRAVKNGGQNYQLESLIGHCHYGKCEFTEACRSYEIVLHSPSRPANAVHLISLRLAQVYIAQTDYTEARNLLLDACAIRRSPRMWLVIGIASYRLGDFGAAEKALSEANALDRHLAEVWGYLALLNLTQYRYQEFLQCYKFAKKTNLVDCSIWEEIKVIREHLNYPDPEPL